MSDERPPVTFDADGYVDMDAFDDADPDALPREVLDTVRAALGSDVVPAALDQAWDGLVQAATSAEAALPIELVPDAETDEDVGDVGDVEPAEAPTGNGGPIRLVDDPGGREVVGKDVHDTSPGRTSAATIDATADEITPVEPAAPVHGDTTEESGGFADDQLRWNDDQIPGLDELEDPGDELLDLDVAEVHVDDDPGTPGLPH